MRPHGSLFQGGLICKIEFICGGLFGRGLFRKGGFFKDLWYLFYYSYVYYFTELSDDLKSRWKELTEGPLNDLNTKNATQMVRTLNIC